MTNVKPDELGGLLFHIHTHDEGGKIIYYEEDLLPILKAMGLPDPKWGKNLTIKEYKKRKNEYPATKK